MYGCSRVTDIYVPIQFISHNVIKTIIFMVNIWCINCQESLNKVYGKGQRVIITEVHLEWLI
jgi:hypothetical protein